MNRGSFYSANNARFLSPEEVAQLFVPLPAFSRLVREGHCVLLGPRGCGKTTLLKMLTGRALKYWKTSERSRAYADSFSFPDYESIYIPADMRWLREMEGLN